MSSYRSSPTGWTPGAIEASVPDIFKQGERAVYNAELDFRALGAAGCTVADLRFLVSVPQPLRRTNLPAYLNGQNGERAQLVDSERLERCLPLMTEHLPDLLDQAAVCDELLLRLGVTFTDWADCWPFLPIPAGCQVTWQKGLPILTLPAECVSTTVVEANVIIRFVG